MSDLVKAMTSALHKDQRAAGALEYALLVSFIAVAVIAGATTFGTSLSAFFASMGPIIAAFAT